VNEAFVMNLAQNALILTLIISGPILIVSLVIGSLISLFQAATQINELTLTFVPKILGVTLILALLGSWMGQKLIAFTTDIISSIANLP
jgi:flagellar biosynthetic protein FliQ